MQLRESLRKIDLTDSRRMFRRISTWVVVGFAAAGALTGGSLALAVLVIGTALGLRNRQLGSGILTGVVAIATSLALGPVFLVQLGLVFGGVLMVASEPILYVLQRRERRSRCARTLKERNPRGYGASLSRTQPESARL